MSKFAPPVTKKELKRHGLTGSVQFLSEVAGVPPTYPQACKVRIADDCFEPAVMLGLDEYGDIRLLYGDGEEEIGIYGADEIYQ